MVYYNEIDRHAAAWLRALIAEGHIARGDVDERDIREVSASDLRGFSQCHFFAGIGVWSYALGLAGWPDDAAVWTGSCPCQPFSGAGKRKGTADERHLWPDWFRLIRECRPPVVFGEQVASKDGLQWLDLVSADLEGAGYAVGAADLCAAGVGAPHIRQRLWLVAKANADGDECRKGRAGGADAGSEQPSGRGAVSVLGDPDQSGLARRSRQSRDDGEEQPPAERTGGPTGGFWRDAEWVYCRDGKWRPTQPGVAPLAIRPPARMVRLRGYGNSIVAPLAAEFIRAYLEAKKELADRL